MSRIVLTAASKQTLVGALTLQVIANIVTQQGNMTRLMAIVNQITVNGATPANLESSAEALFPAGQGASILGGLTAIKTALDGLAATVSAMDQ